MKNFWLQIKKPIYALAPMAGYTDSAFRQICQGFGADVVYSEMASATALVYSPKKTLEMLEFNKIERPYVAQLFGSEPKHFVQAVKKLVFSIPDGIDINFGCPVKKVAKQNAGAVLMNNLKLAREIIKSVVDSTELPVSIKTRSKVGEVDVLRFLDSINDLDIKAIMIHGRTLAQGFSGPVDWEIIRKAKDYFNGIILANGGIYSYDDAVKALDQTQTHGLGIARGALGRPWIFRSLKAQKNYEYAENKEKIFKVALKHAQLVEKLKGEQSRLGQKATASQGIIEMRKHLCWYVQGLPGARKLRQQLVKVKNLEEIKKILRP